MREERLTQMEAYIRTHRSVSLDTLCEVFGISKNTVRRDIGEIVARTDIRKIYGGVSTQYNGLIPPPFIERSGVNSEAKDEIARCAAGLVADGDIIYVDSGTTTCRIVDHLQGRSNVTILTHSLDVINRAAANPALTLISLSGTLNRKTQSFTGQSTIDVLRNCNIGKAFMAANGVTVQNGATQSTSIEFAIKKSVVERSSSVYLMVEHRKFGTVTLLTYCTLDRIDAIITEKLPPKAFQEAFLELGGRIVTPEGEL